MSSISDFNAMDFDTHGWDDSDSQDSDLDSTGGSDADDEHSLSGDDSGISRPIFQTFVRHTLQDMYANRYEAPRDQHPRGPSLMQFTLDKYKRLRPDLFRQDLRVSPDTFDKIVEKIANHPIFFNNSNCPQSPVEDQLAITLFCFGHYGNAASLERVRKWAGTSKGLVKLATRRVMTALLSPDFMQDSVRLPTDEEKEDAKTWVEEHSCKAWRNGWCLVDGTLIPLYARPYWYGESYFDRKCNYSLNVQVSHLYLGRVVVCCFSVVTLLQVVSLPNLRVIDFSYGHTGSTHDSTAWEDTRIVREREEIIKDGEWIWADSAYPVRTFLYLPLPHSNYVRQRSARGLLPHIKSLNAISPRMKFSTTTCLISAYDQNMQSGSLKADSNPSRNSASTSQTRSLTSSPLIGLLHA